jgi:type I restriction enzyme M protein
MNFEQTFKNIDDVLRRETDSELDYIEQTSWILFLRYLDELEQERADEAELRGEDLHATCIGRGLPLERMGHAQECQGRVRFQKAALTGPDLVNSSSTAS